MMSTNRAMATLVGMTVFWAAMLILATATVPARHAMLAKSTQRYHRVTQRITNHKKYTKIRRKLRSHR